MPTVAQYKTGAFSWCDLATGDNDAAKRFYAALLGWEHSDSPMSQDQVYTLYSRNGRHVAGSFNDAQTPGAPPRWQTYFMTHNLNETVANAKSLGGEVLREPFEVFEDGVMAIIKDTQGAVFSAWQPVKHIGAGLRDEPGAPCWAHLSVAVGAARAAADFYCGVFGLKSADMHDGATIELSADGDGAVSIGADGAPPNPGWLVFFQVADIDETLALATELGGKVLSPPSQMDFGRLAVIGDPQGTQAGLFEARSGG